MDVNEREGAGAGVYVCAIVCVCFRVCDIQNNVCESVRVLVGVLICMLVRLCVCECVRECVCVCESGICSVDSSIEEII